MNGRVQTETSARSRFGRVKTNFTGRIVGGVQSDIKEYPWQVSLHASFSHQCGGSVITNDWIERDKNNIVFYNLLHHRLTLECKFK